MTNPRPRNRPVALHLVAALFALAFVAGTAVPAFAQTYMVGVGAGIATDASEEFDSGDFGNRHFDLRLTLEAEPNVLVRMKLGRIDFDSPDGTTEPDVQVERVGVDVEYQSRLSFYKAGVFLGGGYYRFKSEDDRLASWDDGEDHWGWWGGVNGWFPISEGVIIVPELILERIDQKNPRTVGRLGLALELRF